MKIRIRGLSTVRDLLSGQCTLKQLFYQIQMRFSNTQTHLKDDFDWTKYHKHYREELRVMDRFYTLLPEPGTFTRNGPSLRIEPGVKPLSPYHHLLYETILALHPGSALEVGCGGGDHLRNLKLFAPEIELYGIDRSDAQLCTLRSRHPDIQASLAVMDVTNKDAEITPVDLIYTHTVLMHISETGGRYSNALLNIFKHARSHVVLMENWTRHEFLRDVRSIVQNPALDWQGACFYYTTSAAEPNARAMIISKTPLPYSKIEHYDDLLRGSPMELNNK